MEIFITLTFEELPNLDAIVEEQDTCLLLKPTTEFSKIKESYPALIKQMQDQSPYPTGTVMVKGSRPAKLIAVIYDLEKEPICKLDDIKLTLSKLITIINKHRLKRVAMPLLGTSYGAVGVEEFLSQLGEFFSSSSEYPERLWLAVSLSEYLEVFSYLQTLNPVSR